MAQNASEDRSKLVEEIINHIVNEGGTLKDIYNLTKDDMEAIYSVGYSFYQAGKFEDAEKIFRFLCLFDHMEQKYWMGMGAVFQMLGIYDKAIEAYSYAAFLDISDPRPPFHAADCYLALGDKKAAASALHAVLELSEDNETNKTYKEKAKALLKLIEEEKNSEDK